MLTCIRRPLIVLLCSTILATPAVAKDYWNDETPAERDQRMQWWRDARLGMFIHWGLYAVPGGEWNGRTNHAEWIRHTAQIPMATYDKFLDQFNPVEFDAEKWVLDAKKAGMKYLVITSKHHDGFCLWPSALTDYDVASTPFRRDILGELKKACDKHDLTLGFYYSIMDWHHPNYPPRGWEKDRPKDQVDMDKYTAYMKGQLKELVENYDPAVLWFDGEWEGCWTHEMGKDLYQYVRSLKPEIIINNRVDKGRRGMQGMTKEGEFRGDFGTPEQEIPETGLPGVDWESCMTMNRHWGWNKNDRAWKSTRDLVHKIIDIASKGGNYLLNVGPKPDGTFPDEAIKRLSEIGQWMDTYGDSIHGTSSSALGSFDWGRSTVKPLDGGKHRLFLHVFKWPENGQLTLPGLSAKVLGARLMSRPEEPLAVDAAPFRLQIEVPEKAPNEIAGVVAIDLDGRPKVAKLDPYADESQEERDARMGWWRDAKFGMFIHWGVYAVPAGTYNGKKIGSIGEWIMLNAKIPVDEYKAFAKDFNPVKYDPDFWAQLAKEAGMNYVVITSKHHDGFALYDSKVTDWDIADATPYGKDLLAPLVEAVKKRGLKMGFYYSQAQDWNHPGGAKARYREGDGWDPKHKGDFDKYLRKIAYPQVKEILSNYDLDILWWDTPIWMNRQRAELLLPLLHLRPGIIHNNRLGGGYRGDTDTPEQHIPATGIPGRDWEVCMTMNGTWGYKSYDDDWKSTEDLIHKLVDIVSKGGNFLLNIGPKPDGTIPRESIDRLRAVGDWMDVNGEAIYGTTASPTRRPAWGRITTKADGPNTTLYLHVFNWPADGKLPVAVSNHVEACYLLAEKTREFEVDADPIEGLVVRLIGDAPDAISSTVVLNIQGKPEPTSMVIMAKQDGTLTLEAAEADIHNVFGTDVRLEYKDKNQATIGFWLSPRVKVDWAVKIAKPAEYEVFARVASTDAGRFTVEIGDRKLQASTPATGAYELFQTVSLGKVKLDAGTAKVTIVPDAKQWKAMNLRHVVLKPQ